MMVDALDQQVGVFGYDSVDVQEGKNAFRSKELVLYGETNGEG